MDDVLTTAGTGRTGKQPAGRGDQTSGKPKDRSGSIPAVQRRSGRAPMIRFEPPSGILVARVVVAVAAPDRADARPDSRAVGVVTRWIGIRDLAPIAAPGALDRHRPLHHRQRRVRHDARRLVVPAHRHPELDVHPWQAHDIVDRVLFAPADSAH
jgi:hypothetical protein